MGISNATLRMITAAIGCVNVGMVIFVFAAPFWRCTATQRTATAYNSIWGYEGLWLECISVYRQQTQCNSIGMMVPQYQGTYRPSTNYYQYGVYAYLNAYRAFMVIALITSLAALALSVTGMKVVKVLDEGSRTKRWVNIGAGVLYFATGILVGISVSWYAGEVVHEFWSPYYQTTRLKYTLGACLYIGWISTAFSFAAGCLLTCCTCFNSPVASNKYEVDTVDHIGMEPAAVVETPLMYTTPDHHADYYEHKSSRHSKSHKSHRSHRSHRTHHSEKQSSWDTDTDDDHHNVANGYLTEDVRMDGFV